MTQTTSPAAASAKWPNTTGGRKWVAVPARAPPCAIHVRSMNKPNPAVMIQVTRAAIAMSLSFAKDGADRGGSCPAGGGATESGGLHRLLGDADAVVVGELAAKCT